jgi:hypothetical protein
MYFHVQPPLGAAAVAHLNPLSTFSVVAPAAQAANQGRGALGGKEASSVDVKPQPLLFDPSGRHLRQLSG